MARKYDLPTASRKESMGICFIGNRKGGSGFGGFLGEYAPNLSCGSRDAEQSCTKVLILRHFSLLRIDLQTPISLLPLAR